MKLVQKYSLNQNFWSSGLQSSSSQTVKSCHVRSAMARPCSLLQKMFYSYQSFCKIHHILTFLQQICSSGRFNRGSVDRQPWHSVDKDWLMNTLSTPSVPRFGRPTEGRWCQFSRSAVVYFNWSGHLQLLTRLLWCCSFLVLLQFSLSNFMWKLYLLRHEKFKWKLKLLKTPQWTLCFIIKSWSCWDFTSGQLLLAVMCKKI